MSADPARWVELVGYVAAVLTTVCFVPQAWHTFRTRDVSGISLGMYSVFAIGVALWPTGCCSRRGRSWPPMRSRWRSPWPSSA